MATDHDRLLDPIRKAAQEAGNRYMREHPDDHLERGATWTMGAANAAAAEFRRLCYEAGIDPDKSTLEEK